MLVVIALGGNALLRRSELASAETQRRNVQRAIQAVAEVARLHTVVVTHGNGPQVGLLALQAAAYTLVPPYPLDVLGAESEGMVGYWLEQELVNQLPGQPVATLLTQTLVEPDDPAFAKPTKFVGPTYTQEEAAQVARTRGWQIAQDGAGFRRVVPSPEPRDIVELSTIRLLVQHGVLVVCTGGGGIPVTRNTQGAFYGVEAVVDKDYASCLLATQLQADSLLLLTDVDGIYTAWGTPAARRLRCASPGQLQGYPFASGSMGPKVEAACRFVRTRGRPAAIGALEDAAAILRGAAGTLIMPGNQALGWYPCEH
ncbi:MAG: carbamate kinase [Candidatus Tectomicrobia bacterium]|uniref:Carbamate kinase n=1 Tax=Tectimicrobiota bacterium TaxID=2528274 RepID=A0A937W5I0_UNCTE|nr:carbamate kinase [Candidatus Tectomicrobia bacterium]